MVRTLLVATHVKKIAELEAQISQLRMQQAAQEQAVGTITSDHHSLAIQLPTFATEVPKAQATVSQLGAQVGEAQMAFADHHMKALAQVQAQYHAVATQCVAQRPYRQAKNLGLGPLLNGRPGVRVRCDGRQLGETLAGVCNGNLIFKRGNVLN